MKKRIVFLSFIFALLSMIVSQQVFAASLICNDTTATSSAAAENNYYAQTFTVGSNPIIVSHVQLGLGTHTSGTHRDITVEIRPTTAGVPNSNGTAVVSGTKNTSTMTTTNPQGVVCNGSAVVTGKTYALSTTLQANTTYAIVLVSAPATRTGIWGYETTNSYADGQWLTSATGNSWTPISARDFTFEIIGSEIPPTPTPSPTPNPVVDDEVLGTTGFQFIAGILSLLVALFTISMTKAPGIILAAIAVLGIVILTGLGVLPREVLLGGLVIVGIIVIATRKKGGEGA